MWAAGGWDVAAQPRARLERAHAGTEEPTAEPSLVGTAPGAARLAPRAAPDRGKFSRHPPELGFSRNLVTVVAAQELGGKVQENGMAWMEREPTGQAEQALVRHQALILLHLFVGIPHMLELRCPAPVAPCACALGTG